MPLASVTGAALAPAHGCRGSPAFPFSHASFRAGTGGRPRWKRHLCTTRIAATTRPRKLCGASGVRPHPTSLRSATFPGGEGCMLYRSPAKKAAASAKARGPPHPPNRAARPVRGLPRPCCAGHLPQLGRLRWHSPQMPETEPSRSPRHCTGITPQRSKAACLPSGKQAALVMPLTYFFCP